MTVKTIIQRYMSGEHIDFLFFYGHTTLSLSVGKQCLSQHYTKAPFELDSFTFKTAEHYMMYGKAKLFGDIGIAAKIVKAETAREVKALGRKIKNFDQATWDEEKFQIVVDGNIAKFSQNSKLGKFLLSTDDAVIVEAALNDNIWGIKMHMSNPDIYDPRKWEGENLLGFALMKVREILQ